MKIPTEAERQAEKNTADLQAAFNQVCREMGVHQGMGPPMAYFETTEGRRYVYTSFGMTGEKPQGMPMATCEDFGVVWRASVKTFREWLQPNRTLVWREKPSADLCGDDGRWASYWRCIQLEDDARELNIVWHF